ncbi:MAG: nucleoside triphosphate pyrophosphohydrolase, partial [Desulfatitalea sp.]|nr:nucleoside triphosphate pyrophosphohydrolase [Desulfatitalea sp.]
MALIATLRGKKGCPWDRKQTPSSMSVYLVEETFELVE